MFTAYGETMLTPDCEKKLQNDAEGNTDDTILEKKQTNENMHEEKVQDTQQVEIEKSEGSVEQQGVADCILPEAETEETVNIPEPSEEAGEDLIL